MVIVPTNEVGTFIYELVSVTEDGFGCSQNQSDSATIVVHPDPIASFIPLPNVIMISDNISHMVNASEGAVEYSWDFGDGEGGSTVVSPYHQFEIDDQESFTITLTATSEFGCVSIAIDEITVKEDELIYVPNTFTPDGNNFNSIFIPVIPIGSNIYSFRLDIYNRWGENVFTSNDISVGWNGMYNGKIAQDGTYTWIIEYKSETHINGKRLKGHVNLLR